MLHEVLKLVTYLSILATTSSSNFLSKETVANYRRASPSISSEQYSRLPNDGEGFEWTEFSNIGSPKAQPNSDYLIPKFDNMLYTQLNSGNSKNSRRNSNNRKFSQRVRGKKDNNNKLINSKNNKLSNLINNYDPTNTRKNIASSNNDESNNVKNITSTAENEDKSIKVNVSSSGQSASNQPFRPHFPLTNEYPVNQILAETEHDRDLQQLFGIEGAKKYQSYQLKQQILNENEQDPLAIDDEGIELKEPQVKRSGDATGEEIQDVSGAMANQIMPRATRRQREYDVPLIREYFLQSFFLIPRYYKESDEIS